MSYTNGRLNQRRHFTYVDPPPDYSFMETSPLPRHQLIESKILQRTDNEVDTALCLWEKRALELTAIIGEGGFSSLYARAGFVD